MIDLISSIFDLIELLTPPKKSKLRWLLRGVGWIVLIAAIVLALSGVALLVTPSHRQGWTPNTRWGGLYASIFFGVFAFLILGGILVYVLVATIREVKAYLTRGRRPRKLPHAEADPKGGHRHGESPQGDRAPRDPRP